MKCLKENCIHHAVCALYTFSGYNSDECAFYENRPHGEWIKDGFFAICSECGHELQHYGLVVSWLNFCPNCGASMRKEGGKK